MTGMRGRRHDGESRVRRNRLGGLSAVLSVVGVLATHAQAQDGDVRRGLAYSQQNCSGCHAVDSKQERPVRGIATFKQIANAPGMTALALSVWFQSPHPNMPNLILAPADRDDVIAYITSLREAR